MPKGGLQPWTMTLLTPLAYWATAGAGIAKFITRSAEHVTAPSHSQLKFHRNFLLKRFRNPSDSVAVYFFQNFKIVEKDIKCYLIKPQKQNFVISVIWRVKLTFYRQAPVRLGVGKRSRSHLGKKVGKCNHFRKGCRHSLVLKLA